MTNGDKCWKQWMGGEQRQRWWGKWQMTKRWDNVQTQPINVLWEKQKYILKCVNVYKLYIYTYSQQQCIGWWW